MRVTTPRVRSQLKREAVGQASRVYQFYLNHVTHCLPSTSATTLPRDTNTSESCLGMLRIDCKLPWLILRVLLLHPWQLIPPLL